ncbi:MAG: hypothetical protein Q7J27_02975, partial [Syntrophales bacterium]|nr:hypothetical protein [Syntrophales bacterium]
RALHNTNIVIASKAKQSRNILTIHKIAASLKLLAMTRIAVLQNSRYIPLSDNPFRVSKSLKSLFGL